MPCAANQFLSGPAMGHVNNLNSTHNQLNVKVCVLFVKINFDSYIVQCSGPNQLPSWLIFSYRIF